MKVLLKKYLLIYFSAIVGVVLVIAASFMFGDFANKLKPDDQVLISIPAEADEDAEPLLHIYIWENVWNDEVTVESTILSEMNLGETVHTGYLRKAIGNHENLEILKNEDVDYYYNWVYIRNEEEFYTNLVRSLEEVVFVVEADGCIKVETSMVGMYYGSTPDNYLAKIPDPLWAREVSGNYAVMLITEPVHTKQTIDISNALDDKESKKTNTSIEWDKKSRNDVSIQHIRDVYPQIQGEYGNISRKVSKSALLISLYDMANEDKLLAQAEIRITGYFPWDMDNADLHGKKPYEVLDELGINIPDSYGYTEAVLYDYWQAEEW